MYKKTVRYTDFDGNEREEDLYFNLSKSELTEMEMSYPGGYAKQLQKIGASKDNKEIYKTFKDIVGKSYGIKSEDGRRFRKSPEILQDFLDSAAYDEFMVMLLSDEGITAAEFVNGIMPSTGLTNSELYEKTKELIDGKKELELPGEPSSDRN